jgi:nucleoid-associated protein YgaU
VIKPGETLRTLAKTYYGDANAWETIYDANIDKVERGLPQEGSTFVIPAPPEKH